MKNKIDFIGDIHGYADHLKMLLIKLGYSKKNGHYSKKNGIVIFVGDYIDRGPKIRETLKIVKDMVDNGNAVALLGNHEYNAICFNTINPENGGYVREHEIKNIVQHFETLKQFENHQKEYNYYIEWFKTLPLFYETNDYRAVHACWDNKHINYLKSVLVNNKLDTVEIILKSTFKNTKLNIAINTILNGKKIILPSGFKVKTKDGRKRDRIRIKWWENNFDTITYSDISVEAIDNLPKSIVDNTILLNNYNTFEKPVFFGHYWLEGLPSLQKHNVCCLDYSIAKKGSLVSYKYNYEKRLSNENYTLISYIE